MKPKLFSSTKKILLLFGMILITTCSFSATYTAVASGNWSSALTWGGSRPPFTLGIADQVTIGAGITVTMDSNVNINGLLAQVSVAGTLSSATNNLTVTSGTLTGAGTVTVNDLVLTAGGTFTSTGAVTANTLDNSISSLAMTAQLTINKVLNLMSLVTVQTGGSLTMASHSVINLSGSQVDLSGGTLSLSSVYDVNYITASTTSGLELSGSGLRNITVNVGGVNSVTLGGNLTTSDSLKMLSGSLLLNGHNLTIDGSVNGPGTFEGDASANLTVNTLGGISVPVTFSNGYQMLNNLTANIGSGNLLALGSALTVSGTLNLSGGSKLDISGRSLTLSGNFNGSGSITTNSQSMVTINTAGSIATAIPFSGSAMADFNLNVGNGNTVTLGSALLVDTLNMQSGSLVLNSENLSILGDIKTGGSGVILSSVTSNVFVATSTSPSDSLTFQYPNNMVNNFTVSIGSGGSLKLGSDLSIEGALNFTGGYLNVNSHNLQIGTSGFITGVGNNSYVITGTSGYLTMNATLSGSVNFPVGTASYYFPATITLNNGSATGTIGVNVSSNVYSQGTSGTIMSATQPLVNATWLYETSIVSGLNATMQLTWASTTEVNGFVHTGDFISHYTGGNWDVAAAGSATAQGGGMFSMTRNNITSFSPYAVFDQGTLGVNEVVANEQFDVYPNPATNTIYIMNNDKGFTGLIKADIYNVVGEVVESVTINSGNTAIPLDGLSRGAYFVKLYNNEMSVVKKFSKL